MQKTILSDDPMIYIIGGFLSHDECDHFINISVNGMVRSVVSCDKSGIVSNGRTSSNCWIQHDTDTTTSDVAHRIAQCVGFPIENAESYHIVHYSTNRLYRPHYDAYKKDGTTKSNRCLQYGGQRILTTIVYLNNVEEGGHTVFPILNLSIEPKKGNMLVFYNCVDGTTELHTSSLHAGNPPTKGDKFIFNLWFREGVTDRLNVSSF